MRIVDAHQHVWDPRGAEYPWLTPELRELEPRLRRWLTSEPISTGSASTATVLVQAADNLEDTANMLREAAGSSTVAGVVAWVPLERPHECGPAARRLDRLRTSPSSASVTWCTANLTRDWVLRPDVLAGARRRGRTRADLRLLRRVPRPAGQRRGGWRIGCRA